MIMSAGSLSTPTSQALAPGPGVTNRNWQTAQRRERRLRLAVVTSMGSKVATLALQFLALPVAIRSVPAQEFGAYAVMAATLSFLSLSDFGLGPALTRRMADAHSRGQLELAGRTLISGVAVVSGMVGLLWLVGLTLSHLGTMDARLSASGLSYEMLVAVLGIGSAQVWANPFLRAQAGLQELYINNIFVGIGTFAAAAALLVVAAGAPSARNFLLAVYGPVAAAQLANSLYFIFRHRYLLESRPRPSWAVARPLMGDGLLFAVPQTIGPMVLREAPKLVLFQLGLASVTASYAVLIQMLLLISGVVFMFTQPLLPALIDAQARGDQRWISATRRRGLRLLVGFVVLFMAGCLSIGPALLALYSGGRFAFDRTTLLLFSFYGTLMLWNHLGFVFASAAGRLALFFRFSLLELSLFGTCMVVSPPPDLVRCFSYLSLAFLPTALLWPRLLNAAERKEIVNSGEAPA